jgi:hypothetical protein
MAPISHHQTETVDQARLRLAKKAWESGVTLRFDPDGRWYASSVSHPGTWHFVTAFSCDCLGFIRVQRCMHNSALLACLGWLPDDEPHDPDPVPMIITLEPSEAETLILIDGVAKVRITGDRNSLSVHWLHDGRPIDDLTGCTASYLDHHGAVRYWIESIDTREPAEAIMRRAGLRCPDEARDAA